MTWWQTWWLRTTRSNSVSVLLGNGGSITFQDAVDFPRRPQSGVRCGGRLQRRRPETDVVVSDIDANAVSVLLNACGYPIHDTVVLPVNPINVTIPAGKTFVTKNISVKVRNADTTTPQDTT